MIADTIPPKTLIRFILSLPLTATDRQALTQTRPFLDYVVKETCMMAGGCTVLNGHGYWVKGAEIGKTVYDIEDNLLNEKAVVIEVVVDSADSARVMKHICNAVIWASKEYAIDMDWVHVTTQWVQTHHFSIAEDLKA